MTRRPNIRVRRLNIPERVPIFIGCEGASEAGYAALLQHLLRETEPEPARPVYLVIRELGRGAGDPLSRVQLAVQRLRQLAATRVEPLERFVLLDSDQAERGPERAEAATRLARDNNITIVWQRPCFEALLLRHLPECATRRPPDTTSAVRVLSQLWTGYQKPMTSTDLRQRIDSDAVRRAAAVEPDLAVLLRSIGFL